MAGVDSDMGCLVATPFRGILEEILDKDTYVDEDESLHDFMAHVAACKWRSQR